MFRDKDNELKRLRDPYSLLELKSLLCDLESSIESVNNAKGKQYDEMTNLCLILDKYNKEREKKAITERPKLTIPKRRTKKP